MKSLTDLLGRMPEMQARAKAKAKAKAKTVRQLPSTPEQANTAETLDNSAAREKDVDPAAIAKRNDVFKGARGLMPVHHPNRDFFLCDLFDYALKDDGVSMEAPIFSLATKPDKTIWHWESKDGSRSISVTPSVLGRATQFDKDLLIYVVSQMTEALNRDRPDAQSRTVRFRVYDYLVSTNKPTGGKEYQRLEDALERLRGTSIKTNIKTGGYRVKEGFGIVDTWAILEKAPDDERMVAVEITLSKWLFNAVQAHEVLTISPDYFRLRRPIERRLYELARKHCGEQPRFVIGLQLLQEKCGSQSILKEFRRSMRELIQADTLPDYRMLLDDEKDQVAFCRRPDKPSAGRI